MLLNILCLIGMFESFVLLCMQGNTIALDWLFLVAFLTFGGATMWLSLTTLLGQPARAQRTMRRSNDTMRAAMARPSVTIADAACDGLRESIRS